MRARRKFSEEFKKEAVALTLEPGMSVNKVATDLDLTPSSLTRWVREAKESKTPKSNLQTSTSNNDKELVELRKENRMLKMEREILKKATAFFAKESN